MGGLALHVPPQADVEAVRARGASGALLAPYAAWVGFATLLSAALWRLNP